jgi:hypothetical protein
MADELAVAYGYHAVVGDFTWWMLAWLQGGRIPPLFKEDVLTLQCLGVVYKPLQKVTSPRNFRLLTPEFEFVFPNRPTPVD